MLPRDAEQLDPRFVGDPYGLRVSRLLFGSLVTIDPRTLEVIPDLAESVTAKSPMEFVVRLKPGLRFSDGSPLEADDVVATFEGIVDPALRSRYAHAYRRIAEMRVSDPLTVTFVLDEPHATFLTDLEIPIVRSEDARRRIATPEDPFPVGAGPYRLVSRDQGVLELRAPFGGEIVERTAVRGAVVDVADVLFTVADTSVLWAMANIPESQLRRAQRRLQSLQ